MIVTILNVTVLAFKVAVLTIQITIKSIERCNHSGSSTIDYGHKEIYEITDQTFVNTQMCNRAVVRKFACILENRRKGEGGSIIF